MYERRRDNEMVETSKHKTLEYCSMLMFLIDMV